MQALNFRYRCEMAAVVYMTPNPCLSLRQVRVRNDSEAVERLLAGQAGCCSVL